MAKVTLHLDSESRADLAFLNALKLQGTQVSRATLKTFFKNGTILFKNKSLSASHIFSGGHFEITYPDDLVETKDSASPSLHSCFLDILYEDNDLLILNKKSGVPTLPHSSTETETAVGAALAHYSFMKNVGNGGLEPGLLHRLDTGTSGALAFAKNDIEFNRLKKLWSTGSVKKTYRAWVSSLSNQSQSPFPIPQVYKFKLGHDPKSAKKMKIIVSGHDTVRGKLYETETEIASIISNRDQNKVFELEIRIRTGVMHQIRCTLQHLGWPILGDPIYKGQNFSRLMLHAWKLNVPLKNGQNLEVISPLDPNWTTFQLEA